MRTKNSSFGKLVYFRYLRSPIIASLFMGILLWHPVTAQPTDSWVRKADVPGPGRAGALAFSIGDYGYVGSKDFWRYDPVSNTWTRLNDIPFTVNHPVVTPVGLEDVPGGTFIIQGKAYVIAGRQLWEYEPSDDTWTRKADYPVSIPNGVAFSIGNKGYAGLGMLGQLLGTNEFYEYDPAHDTWTRRADFKGASRQGASAFVIGSKGYVGTGLNQRDFTVYYRWSLEDVWEYDPSADTWTRKTGTSFGFAYAKGLTLGAKGYFAGGRATLGELWQKSIFEYDPLNNSWTKKADYPFQHRRSPIFFTIGNNAYFGTGAGTGNEEGTLFTDFWQYTSCSIPPVSVTASSSSLCRGNSVDLTATGAATQYVWIPVEGFSGASGANVSVSPTTTTTYTVVGKDDANCTNYATITITVTPSITLSPSNNFCLEGPTSVTVSGATSYVWSPAEGLSSTTGNEVIVNPSFSTVYKVVGTDEANCVNEAYLTVRMKPSLAVTAPTAICQGESITLRATGASTYQWSVAEGTYLVSGDSMIVHPDITTMYGLIGRSSDGCSDTTSTTITVNPLPEIVLSVPDDICISEPTIITASGASTYLWESEFGELSAGNQIVVDPQTRTFFTVTGTNDFNCTNEKYLGVGRIPSKPTINLEFDNSHLRLLSDVEMGNQWFLNDTLLEGETGQAVNILASSIGDYTVQVTIDGCSSEMSDPFIIAGTPSERQANKVLDFYPNPIQDLLILQAESLGQNPVKIEIYDIAGRSLGKWLVSASENTIEVAHLAPGIYVLEAIGRDRVQRAIFQKH